MSTIQSQRLPRSLRRLLPLLLAVGLFAGASLVSATAFADDSPKIGYVDLQRALNNVEEGKAAKAKLKKDFEAKQQQLTKKQEEVQKLQQSLESGGEMMNDEAKQKKATELQQEMAGLQELYMEMQRDLAEKEGEATKRIFGKMEKILAGIAAERGYDLILEKSESSVLFAQDSMDLTDELVKRFNGGK